MSTLNNKRVTFDTDSEEDPNFEPKSPKRKKLVQRRIIPAHRKNTLVKNAMKTDHISVVTPDKNHKIQNLKERPSIVTSAKNEPVVKLEYPYGSIVSINGYDLDNSKWPVKKDAPTFFGCVEVPGNFKCEDADNIKDDESFISFVVSGEYEWYDKNQPNVLQSTYRHRYLTLCSHPPKNMVDTVPFGEDDFTKWFTKTLDGWRVKVFEAPCYGCGSPWCMLDHDRVSLKRMIAQVQAGTKGSQKQKRFRCYRDAISKRWGFLGMQQRKRCGWCFENAVRSSIPSEVFTGFKCGLADEIECSDDDSVIDLL